MSLRDKILAFAKRREIKAPELARHLNLSRQTMTSHLARLVDEGKLIKEGSTRGAIYKLQHTLKAPPTRKQRLFLIKKAKGLAEDLVFKEVDLKLNLRRRLGKNAHSIVAYAFTEMLNNAIDHSGSQSIQIVVEVSRTKIRFEVRDFGIGIFKNVLKKFKLTDEFSAVEHVLKGKQTTMPQAHSGEGIFFTSRIADLFNLRSHALKVTVDNQIEDIFLSEHRNLEGTLVIFEILSQSRKSLSNLFNQYTNDEYGFDKTKIRIKITDYLGALSRSQARRVLVGLEKFNHLVFDFAQVKQIGQGFADEIFRVYSKKKPTIKVEFENACPPVEFMILRARKG